MYHKSIFSTLLITSVITISRSGQPKTTYDDCLGPSGTPGLCIPLAKCPSLLQILHDEPLKPQRIKFLQSTTCAFDSDNPFVCCPTDEAQKSLAGDARSGSAETPLSSNATPPITTTTLANTIAPEDATTELPIAPNVEVVSADELENHENWKLIPHPPSCGVGNPAKLDRIMGGTIAGLGAYPWMALLAFKGPSGDVQMACGGTVITDRYVLTASHCVANLPGGYKLVSVRLGEYDLRNDIDCVDEICAPKHQDVPVDEIITHKGYVPTGKIENDIALIRLARRVTFGPFLQPICLPQGEMLQRDIEKEGHATLAGWGRTRSKSTELSSVLMQVSVPIVPMRRCAEVFHLVHANSKLQMCAGGVKGKDSCKGDSGGPLMKSITEKRSDFPRAYQFGIVSYGPSTCGTTYPAVYTIVAGYMRWILDHMKP